MKTIAKPDPQKRSKHWKRTVLHWGLGIILIPLLGLILIGTLQIIVPDRESLVSLQHVTSSVHTIGVGIQCAVVASILLGWKRLADWATATGVFKAHEYQRALEFKARAGAFLLAYLLLIPIGPYRVWRAMTALVGLLG